MQVVQRPPAGAQHGAPCLAGEVPRQTPDEDGDRDVDRQRGRQPTRKPRAGGEEHDQEVELLGRTVEVVLDLEDRQRVRESAHRAEQPVEVVAPHPGVQRREIGEDHHRAHHHEPGPLEAADRKGGLVDDSGRHGPVILSHPPGALVVEDCRLGSAASGCGQARAGVRSPRADREWYQLQLRRRNGCRPGGAETTTARPGIAGRAVRYVGDGEGQGAGGGVPGLGGASRPRRSKAGITGRARAARRMKARRPAWSSSSSASNPST